MLAVRLLLAVVFAVSGIAKLMSPRGTAVAARELGVPARLATPIAIVLPLAEIAVAGSLTVTDWATPASAAASALMLAFTVLVAVNLARGRHPACACFGELSAGAAISGRTLVRNLVLLAGSLAVLASSLLPHGCAAGCYDASGARHLTVGAGVLVLIAIGAGLVLVVTLSRLVGQLTGRVRDLEAALGRSGGGAGDGHPGPDVPMMLRAATELAVTDRGGAPHRLADLVADADRTLLVLMSSGCSACSRVREHLAGMAPPPGLQVVSLVEGFDRLELPSAGPGLRIYRDRGDLAAAGGVRAFPTALEVDRDLRGTGETMIGSTAILRYLTEYTEAPSHV